jgi:hypothetical protein
MARRKTLTLTDKHIMLISNIKFEKFVFDDKQHYQRFKNMVNDLKLNEEINFKKYNKSILDELYNFEPQSRFGWGCDQWSLFGGTYLLEDMAMILGYFDKAIENSETLATGRRFPKELEDEMYSLYDFICSNMEDIFTLILSFIGNGGLVPGTYELINYHWELKKEA